MPSRLRLALPLAGGFVATVLLSNYLVERFGIVPVGFGLEAPAAVFAVGLAFTLRDLLHRACGPVPVLCAVLLGASLSYAVAPGFALASGVAFLFSELADLVVYSPLQKRGWTLAVVASNTVGAVIDSVLFLSIAFGSLEFLAGQLVGKSWMTLAALLVLLPARAVLPRHA